MKILKLESFSEKVLLFLVFVNAILICQCGNGGFYAFTALNIKGDRIPLKSFRGKVRT